MTMRKIITMSLLGCSLTLAACDSGGAKGDDKKQAKADAKTDAKTDGDAAAAAEGGEPGEGADAAEESLDPKVEKAVTIANQISAEPDKADTILADAGMDREGFEQLLYEIARDPELSKSYAVARDA